jgi:hypothetical protein
MAVLGVMAYDRRMTGRLLPILALASATALPGQGVTGQVLLAPLTAAHGEGYFVVGGLIGFPLAEDGPAVLGLSGGFDSRYGVDLPEAWRYWEANADLVLRANPTGRVQPFILTGLHLSQESDQDFIELGTPVAINRRTAAGVNVGAGLAVRWGSFAPFLGAKFELRRERPLVIFLGVVLPVGSGGER